MTPTIKERQNDGSAKMQQLTDARRGKKICGCCLAALQRKSYKNIIMHFVDSTR